MAKRLTDTDIWDKEWFMALSPRLKCLVKFVWDKCDLAGVWCPNWTLAKMYINEPVSETELLAIDEGKQFVKLSSGKIFCLDFIHFQNGKLESKSPIHKKILSLLSSHNIPYPYPINRIIVDVIVEEGVRVEENVEVINEKCQEILSSEEWIQNRARIEKSQTEIVREHLVYFLNDQTDKKEIEHRSIQEIKNHFSNWLKIQLKEKNGKITSTTTKRGALENLDGLANAILQGNSG